MGTDAEIWTPGGETGPTGPAGPAGPNIELRTNATHVQWRVEGDVTWIDLILLSDLEGPQGIQGVAGATGSTGPVGPDGSAIELQTTATHVQWRVVGDVTWINLVALSDITGPAGVSSTILRDVGAPDDATDGSDGDYYIQEDEPDFGVVLYGPKAGGTWPANFVPLSGPEGSPSEKVVLNGSGAPANSVGTNGDFFIDTDSYDLYGPKAGGEWPTPPTSLVGPQGPAGNELLAQYGELDITQNTATIAATAAADTTLYDNADYMQVTGIWDATPHGENNGVTQQTNSLTINKTGVYRINIWANVVAAANNTKVAVKFAINGVIGLGRRPIAFLTNTGDEGQVNAYGFHEFTDGDVVTLYFASDKSTDVTFKDAVFGLHEFVSSDADGGLGASTFLDLIDTPSDYTGFAGQPIVVNGTEDGAEFSSANFVFESRILTAAGGLTGGGDLSLNRSFALGTPSTLSGDTTNSVTTDSHTHAVNSTAARSDPSTSTLLQAKAMNDHVGSGDHDTRYAQLAAANTFTSTQAIESTAPDLVFSETDTADQNWRMALASGVLSMQTINDAFVFIAHVLRLTHGGGMQVGSPTGGDKGAGTVNATGLFENGTGIAKLSGGADANFTAMPQIAGDSFVWATKAIGEPFCIRDDFVGTPIPPTDNPNFRFIKLTAGEDGVGEFNEGLLISESVSGSAPLVVATAVIDHAASPINGETVHLWNTEGRYPKPGTSPGTVANDQMQQITGTIDDIWGQTPEGSPVDPLGALSGTVAEAGAKPGTGMSSEINFDFNSANSPGARTGDSTDVKHQQLTYYMRIA